jgi:hypothetical protein
MLVSNSLEGQWQKGEILAKWSADNGYHRLPGLFIFFIHLKLQTKTLALPYPS